MRDNLLRALVGFGLYKSISSPKLLVSVGIKPNNYGVRLFTHGIFFIFSIFFK